jgi:hypothetical protein
MKDFLRSKLVPALTALLAIFAFAAAFAASGTGTHAASNSFSPPSHVNPVGNLDCNGFSPVQKPIKTAQICSDFKLGYDDRGFDNGHYIGHDEPSVQFNSTVPGSGNNVQYFLSLPRERPLPATQTLENQIAFWFSMALCDPQSYPQGACTPDSDLNNPNDAGSAFLEMQFYPPGDAPFISNISCDTTHWCASLHINSLECVPGVGCNPNCIEPTNFAFIQMDGIPTGPAGPDNATVASFTPNAQTLLMNQGDVLKVTISDTPDGKDANGLTTGGVTTRIDDLTTHKSGFMIASAHNGYQSLNPFTCDGTSFSFHPEFSTAKFGNFVPWAALQANVGFASEIGHFEAGTGDGDDDDPPCFPAGPDDLVAGCLNFAEGGDIDFDGTSYVADWPDGTRHNATSLAFTAPRFATGEGHYRGIYPIMQFETDVPASESTCNVSNGVGCTALPQGAAFYPFYSVANQWGDACVFEFGNLTHEVNTFGKDAQYGTPNLAWFGGTVSGGPQDNPCAPHVG